MVERKLHPNHFFSKEEKDKIVSAICDAEADTTGDILLHLERYCGADVLAKAKKLFEHQKLHLKKDKNAVLIYIALKERSFAILGDEGIHKRVGDQFWNGLSESLRQDFTKGEFLSGLESVIAQIGQELKVHFPRTLP